MVKKIVCTNCTHYMGDSYQNMDSIKKETKFVIYIIKKNVILLAGVGIFIFNLFGFSSSAHCSTEASDYLELTIYSGCRNPDTYYYYGDETTALLVIGALMVAVGILYYRKQIDK